MKFLLTVGFKNNDSLRLYPTVAEIIIENKGYTGGLIHDSRGKEIQTGHVQNNERLLKSSKRTG